MYLANKVYLGLPHLEKQSLHLESCITKVIFFFFPSKNTIYLFILGNPTILTMGGSPEDTVGARVAHGRTGGRVG